MFREMRRKEEQMEQKETLELLKRNGSGILSTIGEDGYPYGIPVNYVYWNDAVYIHGAKKGHKVDNLQFSQKVSFCVVDHEKVSPEKMTTYFESVILFGSVSSVSEKEKEEALLQIVYKFSPDFIEKGKNMIQKMAERTQVYRIHIDHITGKAKRE